MKKLCLVSLSILFAITSFNSSILNAYTKINEKKSSGDKTLRNAEVFEQRGNTVSNFQFFMTNYGIFGQDVARGVGGGYWPRGSRNQYLFGSGIWLAAQKSMPNNTINKCIEMSYNPINGKSCFVPGSLDDGDSLVAGLKDKNRLYMLTIGGISHLYNNNGKPVETEGGPSWPLWKSSGSDNFGQSLFISDTNERDLDFYPSEPAYYSDGDMFAVFKDGDTSYFEVQQKPYATKGYPLHTEMQQSVFSWGSGDYKDMIVIMYKIINRSTDTLKNCYAVPVYDVDIAIAPYTQAGATNDRLRYYDEEPDLDLGVAWTNGDQGEWGREFGYIGVSLLASPAVDNNGFIVNNASITDKSRQVGLSSLRRWTMENDMLDDNDKYDLIATDILEADNGAGEQRMLYATGPFNMRPGDAATVVMLMAFAPPSVKKNAEGSTADLDSLIKLIKKGIKLFNNNLSTSIDEQAEPEGAGAFVYEPQPNPASESASVFVKSAEGAAISAAIYNILGEKVLDLPEAQYSAGMNRLDFNTSSLPSGNYIIKINCNGIPGVKMLKVIK